MNEIRFERSASCIAIEWDGTYEAASRIITLWRASKDRDFLKIELHQKDLKLVGGNVSSSVQLGYYCLSMGSDPEHGRNVFFAPSLDSLADLGWREVKPIG